ncbi:MAG: hypothetical protein ACO3A2_01720 [Bdellovibrionia bacterium]
MPKFLRQVEIPGKSSSEIYQVVAQGVGHFLEKAALGKFEIERDEQKKEVRIKSAMFNGSIVCSDARIEMQGQLSLLAAPFKGKLDEGITQWLSKNFKSSSLA